MNKILYIISTLVVIFYFSLILPMFSYSTKTLIEMYAKSESDRHIVQFVREKKDLTIKYSSWCILVIYGTFSISIFKKGRASSNSVFKTNNPKEGG